MRTFAGIFVFSCVLFGQDVKLEEKKLPVVFAHARAAQVLRTASLSDFDIVIEATWDRQLRIRINGKECEMKNLGARLKVEAARFAFHKHANLPTPIMSQTDLWLKSDGTLLEGKKKIEIEKAVDDAPSYERGLLDIAPDIACEDAVRVLFGLALIADRSRTQKKEICFGLKSLIGKPREATVRSIADRKSSGDSLKLARYERPSTNDPKAKEAEADYCSATVLISLTRNIEGSALVSLIERGVEAKLARYAIEVDAGQKDLTVLPLDHVDFGGREEPSIFFPEAKSSDHNESADNEDYHQMKGDSKKQDDPEELVKQLGSSSFEDQGKAAKALEDLGPKALPALDKGAKSENKQIAEWSEKIRTRIEEKGKAIKALIEQLGSESFEEQGKAAEALKKCGPKAVPWLEEAKKSENKQIREWAAKLLPQEAAVDTRGVGSGSGGGGRFGGRFGGRENLTARGGGTRASESAVLAALKWLARHQNEDGSWSAEGFDAHCPKEKCSGKGVKDFDVGVTGLALLAFLGAGYSHLSKDEFPDPARPGVTLKFGEVVKKAIQFLTSKQEKDGCIGDRGVKYMYNHAICAIALAEAYGQTGAQILKAPAQQAIDFVVTAQNPGKGWRYSQKCGDNDTSVTGWCVMALKSAEMAELNFPRAAYDGALAWMKEVTEDAGYYKAGYSHKGTGKVFVPGKNEDFEHHEAMSAIAVVSRIFMQKNKREPALGAANLLISDLPEWKAKKIDFYYWYHASMALYQYDGPDGPMWKKWNEPMKNAIVPNQKTGKDGCQNGSWDSDGDRWGFEGGRVYATAINALTLEVYYRYATVFGKK